MIGVWAFVAPGLFAFDVRRVGHERPALGAQNDQSARTVAAGDVAAIGEDPHAVGILVDDGLMVELVAVLRLRRTPGVRPCPRPSRRNVAQRPGGLVDAVDQRLRAVSLPESQLK